MILLFLGCVPAYVLSSYSFKSIPETYYTEPANRRDYCELAMAYSEGLTVEAAQNAFRTHMRNAKADGAVAMEVGSKVVTSPYEPPKTIYSVRGVLISWGPCQ